MTTDATPTVPPRTFLRIPASEWLRKAVHMGSFGAAFLLPYLTPKQAALMAIGALLFNMFVLPKLMPSIIRREGNSGYLEILMYPAAVLAVVLSLGLANNFSLCSAINDNCLDDSGSGPKRYYIAVVFVWYCLAIGDGLLGIFHSVFRGRLILPWNPRKSWLGLVFGTVAISTLGWLVSLYPESDFWWFVSIASVMLGLLFGFAAVWESVWFGIVDNLTVPFVMTLTTLPIIMFTGVIFKDRPEDRILQTGGMLMLVASLAFSLFAFLVKKLTIGGAIFGFLISVVLIKARPELFLFVVGFFVLGVLATKFGYAKKATRGIAQEAGGRRGCAEIFGSIGVAVWLAPLALMGAVARHLEGGQIRELYLIIISPLIAKTMDTVSSEMGKAIGGTTISLRTFKVVPPGTDGGVSLAGTIWGLAGAVLLASLILPLRWGGLKEVGLLVAFAVAANLFESYWAFWAGPRGVDDGPHTNFMMTLFAATLAWFWWM